MKRVKRRRGSLVILGLLLPFLIFLTSCNVTRTITTTSQHVQRGDTTTIIQTKTIEQYDGSLRK